MPMKGIALSYFYIVKLGFVGVYILFLIPVQMGTHISGIPTIWHGSFTKFAGYLGFDCLAICCEVKVNPHFTLFLATSHAFIVNRSTFDFKLPMPMHHWLFGGWKITTELERRNMVNSTQIA